MKKILFLIILAVFSLKVRAEEPARLAINAGVFAPYTLDATIAYEFPSEYGHTWTVFGEAGTHWQTPVCHMFWKKYFWDGGIEYKHRVVRFKNGNLRIFGGAYAGAFARSFYFGAELGIEYNYTFANNWQFCVSQKNNFNFRRGDTFRNGVMVGVKIPL